VSKRVGRLLDVGICAVIVLVAIQLPNILPEASNLIHHHSFFLGPANDVLHGRAIVGDAWSQYGVGVIDFLALVFAVVPIGFGTFALVVVALTAAQYLCVYATLRLAGLGQALAAATVALAALGNLFSPINNYVVYPSASALRFGLPYLIVLIAVIGARYPQRARAARFATLAVLGLGAVWSLEAFVYCAATYGVLVLIEAICLGPGAVRRVLRGAVVGLLVSAAALALFSLLTLLFHGGLNWGPYFEYLQLYSTGEVGELPVVVFSAGPIMAAAIFTSAVVLLWLARYRPAELAPPMRAALTGFTGLAIATFTYYIGRSHPNNLLILLVPVVALGGLWLQVLLSAPIARWRYLPIGAVLLAGAMIAVNSGHGTGADRPAPRQLALDRLRAPGRKPASGSTLARRRGAARRPAARGAGRGPDRAGIDQRSAAAGRPAEPAADLRPHRGQPDPLQRNAGVCRRREPTHRDVVAHLARPAPGRGALAGRPAP
jgi:hypothetical protein